MALNIDKSYFLQHLYLHCKRVLFKNDTGVYNAECPVCHEGRSAGKNRRFYYIPRDGYAYCHNCNWSGNEVTFLKDVCNKSYRTIVEENNAFFADLDQVEFIESVKKHKAEPSPIPTDCVDLYDPLQLSYFAEKREVNDAVEFLKKRKIFEAINKPRRLFFSINDRVYKNRIIIPYYNYFSNKKIDFFQARAIYERDEEIAKYISRANCQKTIFNVDNIDSSFEYIFILEGAFDSCFVKNGIAISGIYANNVLLDEVFKIFPFHKYIYCFDNQHKDETSMNFTIQMLEKTKNHVFIWPEELKNFKDFNDICIATGRNNIPTKLILDNTFTGLSGILKLKK